MSCDRSVIKGTVFLQNLRAYGEVRLLGANIGSDLVCDACRFRSPNGRVLNCDGSIIGGDVFLRKGFYAGGTLRFVGAKISGDLVCEDANFDSDMYLDGAEIGRGLFFYRVMANNVSLAHAKIATLADHIKCWKSVRLDGFRYERIDSGSALDADRRIAWLDKQDSGRFVLQPWMQLAKVLREQGHVRDASQVDVARENRLRAAGKVADIRAIRARLRGLRPVGFSGAYITVIFSVLECFGEYITWGFHWFYGTFSGYGHRPMRIVYAAVIFWLGFALAYDVAASHALFMPSNPAIVMKLKEDACRDAASVNWTQCEALRAVYPRFSPLAYSLDLILPVVHLGQSNMWTPISDGDWFSFSGWTQRFVWLEEIFGWVAALTLGGIATGLVKRRDG